MQNQKITISELKKEFADIYSIKSNPAPKNIDGIVILTADGQPHDKKENGYRILEGVKIFNLLNKKVKFIFSGVLEERSEVIKIIKKLRIPKKYIYFQECGKRGAGNTKTQFESMSKDKIIEKLTNITIITSTFHIPRVYRTAVKFLKKDTKFIVIANPEDITLHNKKEKIDLEVKKILEYSKKGDISMEPR